MHFFKKLTPWYLENKRNLPWRETRDPYRIWLSEIILQQTRVDQGKPYYLHFLKKFPTVFALADASEEEVLKQWQGLGYYSRARNLHATARFVAEKLGGEFPKSYKGLLTLKGVGDYTASAVASICYNEKVAVVDGNVYRVLSRVFGIGTPIDSTAGKVQFKELAQKLLDKEDPSRFNQALMEFGAVQCTPQRPQCTSCPFQTECTARRQGRIKEFPVKLKKQKVRKRHFNYLVFISGQQKTLLRKREGSGIWEGLYEFPLLETAKEMMEENLTNLNQWKDFSFGNAKRIRLYNQEPVIHKLSHQHIHTKFWIAECERAPEGAVSYERVTALPVPVLIEKFIEDFGF